MTSFRTLDDLGDVTGRRALVRVDLNVPMADGQVTDDTRLRATLPTVTELADRGAIVLLLAHFGRPKGEKRPDMSLSLVTRAYEAVLGRSVRFVGESSGPLAAENVAAMQSGDVAVLENTRFHAGEEKNDPELARAMAELGDLYVNDAFSAAHRAHSSTEALAHLLPAYAGRGMEAELTALQKALGAFETPPFDAATVQLAQTAAALTQSGALVSVAGGGDTVAALNHAGVADDFTFVSTAGGAFLEWMEGKELPGVKALEPGNIGRAPTPASRRN